MKTCIKYARKKSDNRHIFFIYIFFFNTSWKVRKGLLVCSVPFFNCPECLKTCVASHVRHSPGNRRFLACYWKWFLRWSSLTQKSSMMQYWLISSTFQKNDSARAFDFVEAHRSKLVASLTAASTESKYHPTSNSKTDENMKNLN